MRSNRLNKAHRGELALRLTPAGFRRRPDGGVVQDPGNAVRLAVGTVFERFAVLRNDRAVQRHFLENRLGLPRCAPSGAAVGGIHSVRRSHRMIRQILGNPAFAGVFVHGRRLLVPIGNVPPAKAEARHYAQAEGAAMAV